MRFLWYFAALVLVFLAALFFDRFDRASEHQPRAPAAPGSPTTVDLPVPSWQRTVVHLTPLLVEKGCRFSFASILLAELKLILNGLRWWWLLVASGLFLAGLSAPLAAVRAFILPINWLWPVLLWSPMGARKTRHQTSQLFFSAPYPCGDNYQPSNWLACWLRHLLETAQDCGSFLQGNGTVFSPGLRGHCLSPLWL